MAFAKILQGFRSTSNLHGSSTDPEIKPVTVQLIKTPVLLEAPAVSQRKGSRLFKSLVNPKRRERETILPDFNLLEVKGPKIGLDVVKLFQYVDQKYIQMFCNLEPVTDNGLDLLHTSTRPNSSLRTEHSAGNAPSTLCEKSINGKSQEAQVHRTHHA